MTLHSPPPHPAPPQQVASLHLSHLRHRYSESRQQARALKKELRAQRESGRTVLRACQVKLEEQDNLIRKIQQQRDEELRLLTAELSLIRATTLKERARLESAIRSRDEAVEQRDKEVAALRRHNRKLAKMLKEAKGGGIEIDEESSSQDCSPKSSFADRSSSSSSSKSSTLTSAGVTTVKVGGSGDEGGGTTVRTGAKVASLIEAETERIRADLDTLTLTRREKEAKAPAPPPRPAATVTTAASDQQQLVKPPVPSRAGVNRKLNANAATSSSTKSNCVPPTPPVRTSSVKSNSSGYFDSGRESDDNGAGTELRLSSSSALGLSNSRVSDDGFVSSHEDGHNSSSSRLSFPSSPVDSRHPPPPPPPRLSQSQSDQQILRQMSNHREVKRPSDVKLRAKMRSNTIPPSTTSSLRTLAVLEEHQASDDNSGSNNNNNSSSATKIYHWTEPYL